MSILVDKEIKQLVTDVNLIEKFVEPSLQGASYDLGVGSQFMSKGLIKTLTAESPSIVMEAGEFIVLTSLETLNFPLNITGHFGLTSYWGMRGLVPLFGPQIDPGFQGILVVPVFNAGDVPISIPLGERIFTVEFLKTNCEASYGWSDRNGKQERIKPLHTPFETRPNLADISRLKEELLNAKVQIKNTIDSNESEFRAFQVKQNQSITELSGSVKILENRVSDLLSNKNRKLNLIAIILAILALVATVISWPWITSYFNK
jgi:deoxycytidine triphosphate deaminase